MSSQINFPMLVSEAGSARAALANHPESNFVLLKTVLSRNWNEEQVKEIETVLKDKKLIDGKNNIDYSQQVEIADLKEAKFSIDVIYVQKAYDEVRTKYNSYISSLQGSIAQTLVTSMRGTLKDEVLTPTLSQTGHYIYDYFAEMIAGLQKKQKAEGKEEKEEREKREKEEKNPLERKKQEKEEARAEKEQRGGNSSRSSKDKQNESKKVQIAYQKLEKDLENFPDVKIFLKGGDHRSLVFGALVVKLRENGISDYQSIEIVLEAMDSGANKAKFTHASYSGDFDEAFLIPASYAEVGKFILRGTMKYCASNNGCINAATELLEETKTLIQNTYKEANNWFKKDAVNDNISKKSKPEDKSQETKKANLRGGAGTTTGGPSGEDPNKNDKDKRYREQLEKVHEFSRSINLDDHEGREHNGHSHENHIAKDINFLKNRLNKDKSISASTSFPDITTANKAVGEVIKQNAKDISEWSFTKGAQKGTEKGFYAELKENIGYGVDKYNNVKNEIYKVRVVIKFVNNEMKIVTSLPEY